MKTDFIYELNDKDLEKLKDLVNQEYDEREKNKREEAKAKVYKLLSDMRDICYKYDIELYDEYDSIVSLDELTI